MTKSCHRPWGIFQTVTLKKKPKGQKKSFPYLNFYLSKFTFYRLFVCFNTKSFLTYSFVLPTPTLSTICRPLSSYTCPITPESVNVGSSYSHMRGPGVGCWLSDRSIFLSHTPLCISMISGMCVQGMWNAQVKGQVTETHRLKVNSHCDTYSFVYLNVWHHNGATIATIVATIATTS